jgi:hypothetical protein
MTRDANFLLKVFKGEETYARSHAKRLIQGLHEFEGEAELGWHLTSDKAKNNDTGINIVSKALGALLEHGPLATEALLPALDRLAQERVLSACADQTQVMRTVYKTDGLMTALHFAAHMAAEAAANGGGSGGGVGGGGGATRARSIVSDWSPLARFVVRLGKVLAEARADKEVQELADALVSLHVDTSHQLRVLFQFGAGGCGSAGGQSHAGGRHDNDFEDYRSIRVLPTVGEVNCKEEPFLPPPPVPSPLVTTRTSAEAGAATFAAAATTAAATPTATTTPSPAAAASARAGRPFETSVFSLSSSSSCSSSAAASSSVAADSDDDKALAAAVSYQLERVTRLLRHDFVGPLREAVAQGSKEVLTGRHAHYGAAVYVLCVLLLHQPNQSQRSAEATERWEG